MCCRKPLWKVEIYKNIHVNIITQLKWNSYTPVLLLISFATQIIWGFQVKLKSSKIPRWSCNFILNNVIFLTREIIVFLNSSGVAWKEKHLMRFLSCETSVFKFPRHSADAAWYISLFTKNYKKSLPIKPYSDSVHAFHWRNKAWLNRRQNESIVHALRSLKKCSRHL